MRTRILIYIGTAAALVGLLVLALRPKPIPVETAVVQIGPLQVTTEEQGETRTRDRFVVAAPVGGRLLRVLLRDGDTVTQNQAVATLAPVPLSARERDELTARVAAAEAIQRSEEAQFSHVAEDLAQAQRESTRLKELLARALVSRQQFEHAQNTAVTLEKELTAARYRVKSAEADVRGAKASLIALDGKSHWGAATVIIRAPAAGHVLRVLEPSERVVTAGTPLLVLGDLEHMEVMMEMLSSEAVKVSSGMPALLEGWGGEQPLHARVRLVEPYAFTKISALGVEEKRTRVILDFLDSPAPLGDGYRVTGRIVIWSSPRVLRAPIASLFRCGTEWCVFVVDGARARRREVRIAHRNALEAEVLSGLRANERIVRHPPNELSSGAKVSPQS
jgi:HlyD family secretion protein